MKTKLKIAAIIAISFAIHSNAQNRTTVSAMNSEISDNLDLTAVSSIFGESESLSDFERRLNDPKLQISNLDLNNDNRVDYLRVIESVENSTHVVIIQSVIGRDLYQDVATIEIERNRQNKVSIQIVGNAYIYGQNYIYEPVYYTTPRIYASFWVNFYKPYYSCWNWNYYPTYYYAWNPCSVFRYRQNVYGCINPYNTYTYVNYRRCYNAPIIYSSYSCNSYAKQYPQYAFSRRNSNYSNRYELNQRKYSNEQGNYSRNYSKNFSNQNYNGQREYSQNRENTQRVVYSPRAESRIDYSQNRVESPREYNTQRTEQQREYSQNRNNSSREYNTQRTEQQREYPQNRNNSGNERNTQRSESQKNYDFAGRGNNRRI